MGELATGSLFLNKNLQRIKWNYTEKFLSSCIITTKEQATMKYIELPARIFKDVTDADFFFSENQKIALQDYAKASLFLIPGFKEEHQESFDFWDFYYCWCETAKVSYDRQDYQTYAPKNLSASLPENFDSQAFIKEMRDEIIRQSSL